MAISFYLILELADLDRVSVHCKGCDARVELSLNAMNTAEPPETLKKPQHIPLKCPSCGDGWQEVKNAIEKLCTSLEGLKQFDVRFSVPRPFGQSE